jgi:Ca2+-binding EF-hand superfamily protein
MSNVQVAEKETHGSLFARLDANRDGYVSSAEYAALVRNKQKHRGQILALDKDRDGRITETELRGIGLSQLLKWLDVQQ